MGIYYKRVVDPFSVQMITESFENSGNWSGTLSDPNYPSSFTGFSTPSDTTPVESFELADGWT